MKKSFEDMTEDELVAWEDEHDDVVKWGDRWSLLGIGLSIVSLVTIIFAYSFVGNTVLILLLGVAILMQLHYQRRHIKLHQDRGDFE